MNFLRKNILLLSVLAWLLGACSKEPATAPEDGKTRLCLSLDGGAISAQGRSRVNSTRAVTLDESAVDNLWVLQYDASGTMLTKEYVATVTDPSSIALSTELNTSANTSLYLVANTGNASLFTTETLAQAKAKTVAITSTKGQGIPTDASTSLPMVGQSAALTFPLTAAIPVTLKRTVAKVVLTVKSALPAGYPQLTVKSVQLRNVPKTYSTQAVDASGGFTGTTYYPTASAANFTDYAATTGDITAAGTTSTYYLAPNVRGVSTNTLSHLKNEAAAVSGQGAYCTYVEILGTAKQSSTATATNVRYRLYLGKNNTNDFNLCSNTAYTVGITLTGLSLVDARLTIATDQFDLVQGGTEGDNLADAGSGWAGPAIGDVKDNGIIYWIDPSDATKYKVLSVTERLLKWAPNANYVVAGARSETDAKGNAVAIKTAFDKGTAGITITEGTFKAAFPAAEYCSTYTGEDGTDLPGTWYLPAKTDLKYLWCAFNGVPATDYTVAPTKDEQAQKLFNGYLKAADGTDLTPGYVWSGTENGTETNKAWYANFSLGNINSSEKNNSNYVRCVKNIPALPAIGDVMGNGVVYWVDPADKTKYKVVSIDQGIDLAWAADANYVVYGAESDTDSQGNAAAIKTAFDDGEAGIMIAESTFEEAFPAAAWCYNYTGRDKKDPPGTWYLPSKTDLQYLWCACNGKDPISWASGIDYDATMSPSALLRFSGYLEAAGGTGIEGGEHWSSTQNSDASDNSWYVNFSDDGDTQPTAKSFQAPSIRCIKNL